MKYINPILNATSERPKIFSLPSDCYPVRVPWSRLMGDLREFGWTPYRVAAHMAVEPQTAYNWAAGQEPRAGYGAALLNLHRHICGPEYSEKLNRECSPR